MRRSRPPSTRRPLPKGSAPLQPQLEQVKRQLLSQFHSTLGVPSRLVHLALTEAEALAWQTPYPHLLFPSLALEKAQSAARWYSRQETIRELAFPE